MAIQWNTQNTSSNTSGGGGIKWNTTPNTPTAPPAQGFWGKVGSAIGGAAKATTGFLGNLGAGTGAAIVNAGVGIGQIPFQVNKVVAQSLGATGEVNADNAVLNAGNQIKSDVSGSKMSTPYGEVGPGTGEGQAGQFIGQAATIGEGGFEDLAASGRSAIKPVVTALNDLTSDAPALVKGLSYTAQKVLSAIPSALSGFGFGQSQGQSTSQSVGTGATFGALDGMFSVVKDGWKAITGSLADNAEKALGLKGANGVTSVLSKTKQSVEALTQISSIAEKTGMTVTGADGLTKPFIPTKATMFDTMQAWSQTRKYIYDAYTQLAKAAGDKAGTLFSTDDLDGLVTTLKGQMKDATSAFKNSAQSFINDIEDNFGKKAKDGSSYFNVGVEMERMQGFLEKVNNSVNHNSDAASAKISDVLSRSIRQIMDGKITDATGESYQGLRNAYKNVISIEDNLVSQFKKGANKAPGIATWVQNITGVDGLISLAAGDVTGAAKNFGVAALSTLTKYFKDPEVALQRAFSMINPESAATVPSKAKAIGGIVGSGIKAAATSPTSN